MSTPLIDGGDLSYEMSLCSLKIKIDSMNNARFYDQDRFYEQC